MNAAAALDPYDVAPVALASGTVATAGKADAPASAI
jgi:hypothetical protein